MVKSVVVGAHAEDWAKWRSLLYNLYNALISEINDIGSRGKYSTGTRHIAVKDCLVELTADICHQVMDDMDLHRLTSCAILILDHCFPIIAAVVCNPIPLVIVSPAVQW